MATLGDFDTHSESDSLVCSEATETSTTKLKAIQQTSEALKNAIPGLSNELMRAYMSSQNSAGQTSALVAAEVNKAKRAIDEKPKLCIKASLDARRAAHLQRVCEPYDVTFAAVDSQDHCAARAATAVHEKFIFHREFKSDVWRKGTVLKHIGENPIREIMKGSSHHNCLCYIGSGDARDAQRHGETLAGIKDVDWSEFSKASVAAAQRYNAALRSVSGNGQCCNKLFQDCDFPADVAYARNIHDITPKQVAMGMARSGVTKTCGIMMYSIAIFLPEIENLRLPFTDYAVKIDRKDNSITFRGPTDSQDVYRHKWTDYSRWFTGDRIVSVWHGGIRKYYQYGFKLCALDHVTWCMTPIFTLPDNSLERVLPFGENDNEVAVFGYDYRSDKEDIGLLKKPRKSDLITPRVEFFPKSVYYSAAYLLNIQKKEFTTDFAKKAVTQHLRRELGNGDTTYSTSVISFVASHIYQSLYHDNFVSSQATAAGVNAQNEHRQRFDTPLGARILRTVRATMLRNKDDRFEGGLTRYSSEDGREGRIVLKGRNRLLGLVNRFKYDKLNDIKMKPLLFSRQTALIYRETPVTFMTELASTIIRVRDEMAKQCEKIDAPQVSKYKNVSVRNMKPINYVALKTNVTHPNACLIDAFVTGYSHTLNLDCSYYEAAMRLAQSPNLRFLPQRATILKSLENQTDMPVEAMHVLAEEYGVCVRIMDNAMTYEYGDAANPLVYMWYENNHVIPVRLDKPNFPECNEQYEEVDWSDVRDAEMLAEQAACGGRRDDEISKYFGQEKQKEFERFGLLDRLFNSTDKKVVFDPDAKFAEQFALRHLSWQWHTIADDIEGMTCFSGIGKPMAEADPLFWDSAVKDPGFRFDGILLDHVRERDKHIITPVLNPYFRVYPLLLKTKGKILITIDIRDTLMFDEIYALAEQEKMSITVKRAPEASMLTNTCAIILQEGGQANRFAISEYIAQRNAMYSYFKAACAMSSEEKDKVRRIKKHFETAYPYEGYPSYVAMKRKDLPCVAMPTREKKLVTPMLIDNREIETLFAPENWVRTGLRKVLNVTKYKVKCPKLLGARKPQMTDHAALYPDINVPEEIVDKEISAQPPVIEVTEDESKLAPLDECESNVSQETESLNVEDFKEESIVAKDVIVVCPPSESDKDSESVVDDIIVAKSPGLSWEQSTMSKIETAKQMRLAIKEFVDYNHEVALKLPSVCESLKLITELAGEDDKLLNAGEKDFIYIKNGKWKRGSTSSISNEFTHVYDFSLKKVIPRVQFEKGRKGHGIVTREMDPYLCEKLYEKFKHYDKLPVRPLKFTVNQAISGAGKTHEIVTSMNAKDDLIIESTKNGRDDAARKLKKMRSEFKFAITERLPVKTCCSQLLNPEQAKTLWVDEMTLHHRGAIFLCALLANADEVKCYGDCGQNYTFSSLDRFVFKHHKIDELFKPQHYLTTTRRLSQSVTALARRFYRQVETMKDKEIQTTSNVQGMVTLASFSLNNVVRLLDRAHRNGESAAVLTFTRADRTSMEKHLSTIEHLKDVPVKTIVQYQGSEADIVILIRSSSHSKTKGMYSDNARLLTAVTRAKKDFYYLTNAHSDELALQIRSMKDNNTNISA